MDLIIGTFFLISFCTMLARLCIDISYFTLDAVIQNFSDIDPCLTQYIQHIFQRQAVIIFIPLAFLPNTSFINFISISHLFCHDNLLLHHKFQHIYQLSRLFLLILTILQVFEAVIQFPQYFPDEKLLFFLVRKPLGQFLRIFVYNLFFLFLPFFTLIVNPMLVFLQFWH